MDKTQVERKAYSPKEVQEMLGIAQTTVYRWLTSGRLPAVKIGRLWRIPADALEELLSTEGGQSDEQS
ncbi:MAG: helix-turn-helix domain-containing protein [Chloroflexi bacterium]|nr:helix-turn-helix domain-containing protein [Chloroflexota bacterium]